MTNAAIHKKGNESLAASNRDNSRPDCWQYLMFVTIVGKNLQRDSSGLRQLADEVDG